MQQEFHNLKSLLQKRMTNLHFMPCDVYIMMYFGCKYTSRFTVTKYFRWDGNYLVSLGLIFGANDLTTRWKRDSWSRIWFVTGWQKLGVWKLTASKHIWQKWAPKIRVSNSWPNHEIFDIAGSTLNSVVIYIMIIT